MIQITHISPLKQPVFLPIFALISDILALLVRNNQSGDGGRSRGRRVLFLLRRQRRGGGLRRQEAARRLLVELHPGEREEKSSVLVCFIILTMRSFVTNAFFPRRGNAVPASTQALPLAWSLLRRCTLVHSSCVLCGHQSPPNNMTIFSRLFCPVFQMQSRHASFGECAKVLETRSCSRVRNLVSGSFLRNEAVQKEKHLTWMQGFLSLRAHWLARESSA